MNEALRETVRHSDESSDVHDDLFCRLSDSDLDQLDAIKITEAFVKGSRLFIEGQPASSVYILAEGSVKLSTCSSEGRSVILRVSEPGDILGLSAVLSGGEYDATGEALEYCKVSLVPREIFVKHLLNHPAAALSAARELGRNNLAAHRMISSLSHADPVLVKLAKLFLAWGLKGRSTNGSIYVNIRFTHADMAEMIGASRETVTRSLREMRVRGLATLKGPQLVIHNPEALRMTTGASFIAKGRRSL